MLDNHVDVLDKHVGCTPGHSDSGSNGAEGLPRCVDSRVRRVGSRLERVDDLSECVDAAVGSVGDLLGRVGRPMTCVGALADNVDGPSRRDGRLVRCVGCALRGAQCGKAGFSASESVDFTFTMGETGWVWVRAHNVAKGIPTMSSGTKTPYTGPLLVDATALKDYLVDYAPGAQVGLKHEKPGFEQVLGELQRAKSGALAATGIAVDVVLRIETRTTRLEEIRAKKEAARKLYEVLGETEAEFENAREGDIALIARAAQAAAQHLDAGTAAHFETTLKYYSQIADKAVATRRRNAKEGEGEKD